MSETINLLRLYLQQISEFPRLSPEEEILFAQQREAGELARAELAIGINSKERQQELEDSVLLGIEANRKLVESNLKLVVSLAKKYHAPGLSDLDLIQEGNIGLQQGIERYEWRKKFRFSTHAYWWIRKAIGTAILDQSRNIRLPSYIETDISKIKRESRILEQESEEEASAKDIGNRLSMSEGRVKELLAIAKSPASLSDTLTKDEDGSLIDIVADESADILEILEVNFAYDALISVMERVLSPKEQQLIKLRFGIEDGIQRSLPDVGRVLGITRERVRQIETEAIEKMRNDEELVEYMFE